MARRSFFDVPLSFVVIVGGLAGPSALSAQQVVDLDDSHVVWDDLRALSIPVVPGLTPEPFEPFEAMPVQDAVRMGPNIVMMSGGGAALVTGLMVGGEGGFMIASTGGVISLIGLYRYLR